MRGPLGTKVNPGTDAYRDFERVIGNSVANEDGREFDETTFLVEGIGVNTAEYGPSENSDSLSRA